MTQSRLARSLLSFSLFLVALTFASDRAEAQSFRLNRFRAAERPDDGFAVRRVGRFDHLSLSGLATADYAHDPLVLESEDDREERAHVVRHELTLSLDVALALYERALVFAKLDLIPLLKGPRIAEDVPLTRAAGGGVGDLSLGARVRVIGEADDFFALAVQATLITPTAGERAYHGEEGVAGRPELIAELRPKNLRIAANLGTLLRREQRVLEARVGSELVYGLSAGLTVHRMVELMAELWGGFAYTQFARRATTPLEWLAGVKVHTSAGLYAALAAGTGVTRGVGSPDVRAVAQLGWLSRERKAEPEKVVADRDRDGHEDAQDRCPDEAEDRDGVADEDGCVDRDDDRDGVLDIDDRCPAEAEDRDEHQDADGCPEPDNDGDGILDVEDGCPTVSGVAEQRGCPAPASLSDEGQLIVLDEILFETNKAIILPQSVPHLEAVQRVLVQRPEITKLRIEGHTDSTGPAPRNQQLSAERAAAVRRWLLEHEIAPARLDAYGCGEQHPVASDETPEGRAQNRRVVFQVVDPAVGGAASEPPAGCVHTDS